MASGSLLTAGMKGQSKESGRMLAARCRHCHFSKKMPSAAIPTKRGNRPVFPTLKGLASPDEPCGQNERGHDAATNGELPLFAVHGVVEEAKANTPRAAKAPSSAGT